jgi:hypothetical protein
MVKLLLIAALVLPTSARADDDGFNMLAIDSAIGGLARGDTMARATSLGVSVEHPVFTKVRVVAGYDWMWVAGETGHRASLGVRRELFSTRSHAFVDGELGAALALLSRPAQMPGVDPLVTGFVGLRLGVDLYTGRDASPSRTFEMALAVRMLVGDTRGCMLGLTTAWGN